MIKETTGGLKDDSTMTTIPLRRSEANSAHRPADLRQSLGDGILLKLALDAVQSLDWSMLNGAIISEQRLRPQMMLTLLCFCYAARIYGSREIQRAARHDKTVRYICARQFPHWRILRHFRRHNRDLVERCLAYVLKKAWLLHSDPTDEDWAACHWRGPELAQRFAAAAREKIEIAIIMDTAEND